MRDLAAAAGVNPNTMQRALAQLEAEGLVRTERTNGRFVTEDTELIEQLRAEAARNITAADEPEGRNRKERRWFGKKKK